MAKRLKASIWRKAFLRALARTGNVRVAAAEAGVDAGTAYDHRIKDPAFAGKWAAARAKAKAIAAKRRRPLHHPADGRPSRSGAELVLRRSKHGDKMVRAAEGRWCARTEEAFFAELGRTGCVRAAARAAGISTNALYYRRDKYPDFAEQWRAVEEAAARRLPGLLRAAGIASLDPEVEARGLPRINVDQAIAISRLKSGGGEDRRGRDMRGGILLCKPAASREELVEDLLKKLKALGIRRRRLKLAEGWTESEEGHMIPPGWVRDGPDGPETV
ncbi:MAG TPA: hypothetical protein VEW71_01355 [Allosphingosinicella sp.]|nr:hypothetical protein [Allosphingosinicella sp.]